MKVGDKVKWSSQSQGHVKEKNGVIVSIVPKNTPVNLAVISLIDNGYSIYPMKLSFLDRLKRKDDSYIVAVKKRLYWPLVKNIKVV